MGGMQNNDRNRGNAGTRAYKGAVGGRTRASDVGHTAWRDQDGSAVVACITNLARHRYGLLVGVTGDGSAAAVSLFAGEDRVRFYPHSAEELEELVRDIAAWADADAPDISYFL